MLGYYLHLFVLINNKAGRYYIVDKKEMAAAFSNPVSYQANYGSELQQRVYI